MFLGACFWDYGEFPHGNSETWSPLSARYAAREVASVHPGSALVLDPNANHQRAIQDGGHRKNVTSLCQSMGDQSRLISYSLGDKSYSICVGLNIRVRRTRMKSF